MTKSISALTLLAAAAAFNVPVLAADSLKIDLREWNVTLSAETVAAGEVKVQVSNKGKDTHELVFIRLKKELVSGRLPVEKNGGINEDTMAPWGEIAGEIEDIAPKDKKKDSFTLKPGKYAVLCNVIETEDNGTIEAHYSMGMHALLNVE